MRYYPLFLDLNGKSVLVAGAGEVGLRKAETLLKAGPGRLDLLDPALDEASIRARLPHPQLHIQRRSFEAGDIHGRALVFAATGSRAVNARIAALCQAGGVLCNVADSPAESDFIVPALVNAGDLCIALSTGGNSPALARSLRRELEDWVEKRYAPLLTVLGRLRPLVLELGLPTADNSTLFRALVASPLADLLRNGDRAASAALLASFLPEPLHPRMEELLDGL